MAVFVVMHGFLWVVCAFMIEALFCGFLWVVCLRFVTEEATTVVASWIANRSQEKYEYYAYYKTNVVSIILVVGSIANFFQFISLTNTIQLVID